MRRPLAAAGTTVFFVLAPCVVAGLVPWALTGWESRQPPLWIGLRILGWVFVTSGSLVLIESFVRFVVEGVGTPAPVAPTESLIVGGLYRFVRNPMYVAVITAILGHALILGRGVLFPYAAAVGLAVASFVHWYEEPALARRFGAAYDDYRRAVPAWWPRLTPWRAGD